MNWEQIQGFFNSNVGQSLTNSVLGIKPVKAPTPAPTPVIKVETPVSQGMSKSTMAMILGGAVALVAVIIFAVKR